LNRSKVEKLVAKNRVVTIKADKTNDSPEIDALLVELGNQGAVIPFLAIFPGDGGETITFDGPITQTMVLDALREAGPSKAKDRDVAETAERQPLVAR
jgi:thiol:disulfide interchange protein